MAPNKFATMLHLKTNKITLVLVYAVLEWFLIFFLLLNSLFSYLIIKFSHYFGLKQPCLLCSRLDHVFEPHNSKFSYKELICEQHVTELSTPGCCFNHQRLVESHDMCEDCSSSHPHNHQNPSVVSVKSDDSCLVADSDDMIVQKAKGDELLHLNDFDKEPDQNGIDSSGIEDEDSDGIDNCRDIQMGPHSDLINEDDSSDGFSFWLPEGGYSMLDDDDGDEEEEEGAVSKPHTKSVLKISTKGLYANERVLPQHVEFYIDLDDYQLVPVKMVNLEKEKSEDKSLVNREEDKNHKDQDAVHVGPCALDSLKIDDLQIEDLPIEQRQEQKLKGEIHVEVELDVTEMKELSIKKGHQEEIKREVGDAVVLYENMVEMLPSIGGEAEATMREVDFQVVGDQTHDGFNELSVNIPTADSVDVCYVENDETEVEKLTTKGGQNMELKREIVVEVELDKTKMKEASCNKGDDEETEIEIIQVIEGQSEETRSGIDIQDAGDQSRNAQLGAIDDKVLTETEMKAQKAEVPTSDNVEIKIEDFPAKQGQELETLELDDTKTKDLSKEKDHGEGKRKVDEGELLGMNKLQIDFQVSGDQAHDIPLTALNDGVTEESELHQLNVDIASSDLCSTENGEVNILKSMESTDKSQMVEPIIKYQASASSSGLLENGDCGSKKTEDCNYTRSGDQETLEGGVENGLGNIDGVATLEELKSVLSSERDALRALYAELEEERNAASVATNQTMLMISRLQEEKAMVEMEALQYQRMTEEQSEYDQEALQLMNEILVKRERELQEVENELEICRKKVAEYEERERTRLLSQRKNRSCRCEENGEESDGLSVDLNNKSREEDSLCRCEENTPVDTILNLEDSLSNFEEERISILEQLKVLEEKLCTLAEEDKHEDQNIDTCKVNGDSNGYENWRMNGQNPKQLLQLFDAAELDSDDETLIGFAKFELENKRLTTEEEMDHMYDRLHALEADREFIKHCIGSLRKGDRGVRLLQEILQHLRDLKNVELQSRSLYSLC